MYQLRPCLAGDKKCNCSNIGLIVPPFNLVVQDQKVFACVVMATVVIRYPQKPNQVQILLR